MGGFIGLSRVIGSGVGSGLLHYDGDFLLLEDGASFLLLESGDKIILEA